MSPGTEELRRLQSELQLRGWTRMPEQKALSHGYACGAHHVELAFALNTLCRGGYIQRTCKTDDRADNRHAALIAFDVLDKGAIDLDLVEGKLLQVAQRR